MTEKKLKELVGFTLIFLHFVLLLLVFYLFLAGGFRFDEFTITLAIIIPMFSGYTTSIAVYFARYRLKQTDSTSEVSRAFTIMSMALPTVFFVALTTCVTLFALGRAFESFEDFMGTITVLEAAFASYVGIFIFTLFDTKRS